MNYTRSTLIDLSDTNEDTRKEVFEILEDMIPGETSKRKGRKGMDLWKILVLGTLRLNCNWDYDKLKDNADYHQKIREMLGHSNLDLKKYPLQTIKDNASLLTVDILDRINQVVVKSGHNFFGKTEGDDLSGKVDSFVLETDVTFPTDYNLLYDAVRTMIRILGILCSYFDITTWRLSHNYILDMRKLVNRIRRLKSKTQNKKTLELIAIAYLELIEAAELHIEKAQMTIPALQETNSVKAEKIEEIESYIHDAKTLIDQIVRRVFNDETIPHSEKIFSIFEKHTEWISKGKAGVPQELGVRVCVVEDQYGFILHHMVMEKQTDDKVAVPFTLETKERFPDLDSCSYDKGFYSPKNKVELNEILGSVILPKKGKLSLEEKKIEDSQEFKEGRRQHPAIESAINALENHGLDICLDHGIDGFKRYAALGVVARNLQILGHGIQQKELKDKKRQERYRKTWNENRAA